MEKEKICALWINWYIQAEFIENYGLAENMIRLTDISKNESIVFHYTVLKELKKLIKNRNL